MILVTLQVRLMQTDVVLGCYKNPRGQALSQYPPPRRVVCGS